MKFLIPLLVYLLFAGSVGAQTGVGCTECSADQTPLQKQADSLIALSDALKSGSVSDRYLNPRGCFSKKRATANACSPRGWNEMSIVQRAEYTYKKYEELLKVHNLDYSPRVLVCKVMRESTYRPQDQAGSSTASGLSQVTKSTARDLFNRGKWFSSKVEGFENIKSADTYFEKMKTSTVAQMELGLAVLHQKSRDNRVTNIKTLLARYYGTRSSRQNNHYAQKIYDCANCIKNNRNQITESCLMEAKK